MHREAQSPAYKTFSSLYAKPFPPFCWLKAVKGWIQTTWGVSCWALLEILLYHKKPLCWEAFLSSLDVMAKGGQTPPSAFQMVPLGQGRTKFEFIGLVIPLPAWLFCYWGFRLSCSAALTKFAQKIRKLQCIYLTHFPCQFLFSARGQRGIQVRASGNYPLRHLGPKGNL